MSSQIPGSTYLDFTAYSLTSVPFDAPSAVKTAYNLSGYEQVGGDECINVAFILPRQSDPTSFLQGDWATRQSMIAQAGPGGLAAAYGADPSEFSDVTQYFTDKSVFIFEETGVYPNTYVTSAESRTVWVQMSGTQFKDFFGVPLCQATGDQTFYFWEGDLSLPTDFTWQLAGLWFDVENAPTGANMAGSASAQLKVGAQSIGNSLSYDTPKPTASDLYPNQVAADLYNFPLGNDVPASAFGSIGLVEPGVGISTSADTPNPTEFNKHLKDYKVLVDAEGSGKAYVQGSAGQLYGYWYNGSFYPYGDGLERSLDVSVVAAVNPNSDIVLYAGSGYDYYAGAGIFAALQSSLWLNADTTPGANVGAPPERPAVISSSWRDLQFPSPSSPFYAAYAELYVDAALNNLTIFNALGDGGSGGLHSNGLTNVTSTLASPYAVTVGGTSASSASNAQQDPTLTPILQAVLAGDPHILWRLIQGGMTSLPSDGNSPLIETAWNQYYVTDGPKPDTYTVMGYPFNNTTAGGVDTTQPTPFYQLAYGLSPSTQTNYLNGQGRGVPDVSALAGGNTDYQVLTPDMSKTDYDDYGTSAAAPLWASLAIQINAIFKDQHLPQLGYMNDLLYIAAAIAPAAFNDITYGDNISSYRLGGADYSSNGAAITPTGYGYEAHSGYDLVSGLGTPNGLLLARALTAIAHAQTSYASEPDVVVSLPLDPLDPNPVFKNLSGVDQSLLFQPRLAEGYTWTLDIGGGTTAFAGTQSHTFAWTDQFAQQVLQPDFSPTLVTTFDHASQGWVYETEVAASASLSIAIGGESTSLPRGALTAPFGFADFAALAVDSEIRVARPVAIAETVGGVDDQDAIVRIRQNGVNDTAVSFYRVDDFNGAIGGTAPGDAGYAAAVSTRLYEIHTASQTTETALAGPGFGQYTSAYLSNVDSGALIAMALKTEGHTFYAFAQANEEVGARDVTHLWNYGLNTWGWEDLYGGGDFDYNDLVVQLDFTSAYGSAWIA